jgi:hypothetical protein
MCPTALACLLFTILNARRIFTVVLIGAIAYTNVYLPFYRWPVVIDPCKLRSSRLLLLSSPCAVRCLMRIEKGLLTQQ